MFSFILTSDGCITFPVNLIFPTTVKASSGLFVFMPILPNIVTFCSFKLDDDGEAISDALVLGFAHSSSFSCCLN